MKAGQLVVKIIEGGGARTATIQRIKAVVKGTAFLGESIETDDVNAFNAKTGNSNVNYIPGFRSYLVEFDDGEDRLIKEELLE